MKNNYKMTRMIITSLLIAISIVIPMVMPIKIAIEPVSFTLGSHVPLIIAMFISPTSALCVSIGTTIGFFVGGYPLSIVLRAASHMVWAILGSTYLKYHSNIFKNQHYKLLFILLIGIIHGLCELAVITPLYINGSFNNTYFFSLFLLIGLGSVIHGTIDFFIAILTWKTIEKRTIAKTISQISFTK